jgi:transcription elongation GreA/GreB family factor
LGSKLTVVDVDTGEREEYEVVIPDAVDVMDGCISVSSPLGLAFMDRQENDVVTVRLPVGTRELRIEKLLTLYDQAQEQLKE